MLFNSLIFLVFFGGVLIAYRLSPVKLRRTLLLLASYGFYGAWDWRFLPLIWLSTLLDYTLGNQMTKAVTKKRRKHLLWISLAGNLGPLLFFKYYHFILENILALLRTATGWELPIPEWRILLPVGISFYTFQTLSYTIDLYRRKAEPARSLFDFALFVAFFPQLVAGPIEKARNFLPQLKELPPLRAKALRYGLMTFSYGLASKAIVADTCGRWVDQTFANMASLQPIEALLGSFLFSIQIYMDFSGYSLMAIGLARCFGLKLSTNFTQPYLSANITEFWRRWHITLSSWLREYVYIPLGGNRKGKVRQYINLMLTMLVGGLWHGANWTFVVWGGLHGLMLMIHRIFEPLLKRLPSVTALPSILLTFVATTACWVFFRGKSLAEARDIFSLWGQVVTEGYHALALRHSKASIYTDFWSTPLWHPLIWAGGAMLVLDLLQRHYGSPLFLRKWPLPVQWAILLVVWGVVLIMLIPHKPQPFIYFQF